MTVAVWVALSPTGPALGASVILEDETCLVLHHSGGPFSVGLFPWGTDCLYNRFQVPGLLQEVEQVLASRPDQADTRGLADLSALLRRGLTLDNEFYVVAQAD